MRVLTLALVLSSMAMSYCLAVSEPNTNDEVVLRLAIVGQQREFHVGERIPLELIFSTTVANRYQIETVQYDRSGRVEYEQFTVSPPEGAVESSKFQRSIGGGLRSPMFLGPEPWSIKYNLNEWFRFTRPGLYVVNLTTRRVNVKDASSQLGTSPITVRGNPLTIKIIAADAAWQKSTFDQALATLAQPPPAKPPINSYSLARRTALQTLSYLGTPEAVREMARRLLDEPEALKYFCYFGVISAPDPEVARGALENLLREPDRIIDHNTLVTLRFLGIRLQTRSGETREQRLATQEAIDARLMQQVVAALPFKRGKALGESLSTAVNEIWNNSPMPKETTDKLVRQLVAMFDELPADRQNWLLAYRWDKIASPAMLPSVRQCAQRYSELPAAGGESASELNDLSAHCLQRWYELDPSGARAAVIAEITRPTPRFGSRELGMLPDKTLPEVDGPLAEHFLANRNYVVSTRLATLIARYATKAILPQVLGEIDSHIGNWACSIQSPALAYVLRVSPELARPRIEKALAARQSTGCYRSLLEDISKIHYDSVLEEIPVGSTR